MRCVISLKISSNLSVSNTAKIALRNVKTLWESAVDNPVSFSINLLSSYQRSCLGLPGRRASQQLVIDSLLSSVHCKIEIISLWGIIAMFGTCSKSLNMPKSYVNLDQWTILTRKRVLYLHCTAHYFCREILMSSIFICIYTVVVIKYATDAFFTKCTCCSNHNKLSATSVSIAWFLWNSEPIC